MNVFHCPVINIICVWNNQVMRTVMVAAVAEVIIWAEWEVAVADVVTAA